MKNPHYEFNTFCPSCSTLGPHTGEIRNILNDRLRTSVGNPEDVRLSGRARIRWEDI
jgi:hypothetical protein